MANDFHRSNPNSRIISVRQPWAWAIIHAGKNVENRSWSVAYRGPLLIHAAKGAPDRDALHFLRKLIDPARLASALIAGEMVRGAIIGEVQLVGCEPDSDSRWYDGRGFAWCLERPVACEPIPLRGRLGIFRADVRPVWRYGCADRLATSPAVLRA